VGMYELDSCGSGKGPVAGTCEHGNELYLERWEISWLAE
jgi:hypothetical protein